jgi:hypothetical protein
MNARSQKWRLWDRALVRENKEKSLWPPRHFRAARPARHEQSHHCCAIPRRDKSEDRDRVQKLSRMPANISDTSVQLYGKTKIRTSQDGAGDARHARALNNRSRT